MDKGANVDTEQAFNGLNVALEEGYTDIVTLILGTSANIIALNDACHRGDTDIVKLSLDKGAAVNTHQALDGLNVACEKGYTDIVNLLLDKRSDVNSKQALHGLDVACKKGHAEIVDLFSAPYGPTAIHENEARYVVLDGIARALRG